MSDQRYYWLKLKRDFFKRHDIQIIEDMPNGKEYILFYLKLLCESVDHDGRLRFSEQIPYNENMLSTITRTNVDIVRAAIQVFTALDMMEILDDGTFFMGEVQKMLGSETEWAVRKREHRQNLLLQGQSEDIVQTESDKSKSKSKSKSKNKKDIMSELSGESTDEPQKKKSNPKFDPKSEAYYYATWLDKKLTERVKYYKPRAETQLQQWALTFDRMNRIDGISWEDLDQVLAFSQCDDFWSRNIQSADKFREKFSRLYADMENAERKNGRQ